VVESTALEMRHTRKGIAGSNPALSATTQPLGLRKPGKTVLRRMERDDIHHPRLPLEVTHMGRRAHRHRARSD
jgi:hypothetical protein